MRFSVSFLLLVCFASACLTAPVMAQPWVDESVAEPRWSEFCPAEFVADRPVKKPSDYSMSKSWNQPPMAYGTSSLVELPMRKYHQQKQEHYNEALYWHRRHLAFNHAITKCRNQADFARKEACFQNLRISENSQTKAYKESTQWESFKRDEKYGQYRDNNYYYHSQQEELRRQGF